MKDTLTDYKVGKYYLILQMLST